MNIETYNEPKVSFLDTNKNKDKTIKAAIGICYDNDDVSEELIKEITESGHTSVLEHSFMSFYVLCSRVASHQLVRHRIGFSYSQRSQRYVDEDLRVIIPPSILENKLEREFLEATKASFKVYQDLKEKVPKEDARFVLPQIATEIIISLNLRSLINFCELRMCTRAQWEIRDIAKKMASEAIDKFEFVDDDMLGPKCITEGRCPEGKEEFCG